MDTPFANLTYSYLEILLSLSLTIMAWLAFKTSPPPQKALRQMSSLLTAIWALNASQYPSRVFAVDPAPLLTEAEKISYVDAICIVHKWLPRYSEAIGNPFKEPDKITLFDGLGLDPNKPPFSPVDESLPPHGKYSEDAERAIIDAVLTSQEQKEALAEINKIVDKSAREEALIPITVKEMAMLTLHNKSKRVLYQKAYLPMMDRPGWLHGVCQWASEEGGHHDEL
jgi:hypothetical protein